ncbi:hypothetical protein D3C81_1591980 [compost metagenome]
MAVVNPRIRFVRRVFTGILRQVETQRLVAAGHAGECLLQLFLEQFDRRLAFYYDLLPQHIGRRRFERYIVNSFIRDVFGPDQHVVRLCRHILGVENIRNQFAGLLR